MGQAAQGQAMQREREAARARDWSSLRLFCAVAFGITWGVGGISLLASLRYPSFTLSRSNPLLYIAAAGPSIAGLWMTQRTMGRAAVVRVLARAIPRLSRLHWYFGIFVAFVVAELAAGTLAGTTTLAKLSEWDRLLYLLPFTLATDPGPLGEEFGWRGFALPRLLGLQSRLRAAVVLGVVWAVWHLPAFFIPTLTQSRLSFPIFVLNSISLSVIMTWVYLRTGGDLAAMILIHVMANYCARVFDVPFGAEVAAEVVCALVIVGSGGLRSEAASGSPPNLGGIDPADSGQESVSGPPGR
jgi:membrane protease YdiL (CAAX protease family)